MVDTTDDLEHVRRQIEWMEYDRLRAPLDGTQQLRYEHLLEREAWLLAGGG